MKPLLALVGLSVMISLAGPSYANGGSAPRPGPDVNSEQAQAFLTALRTAGITYTHADQVIVTADAMCNLVADGKSDPEILSNLQNSNPGLTKGDAAKFLAMAEESYCPKAPPPSDPGNG